MPGSLFIVPESVSFQEAIALTQSLLSQMETGELPESDIEPAIAALVSSQNGARGFFVTYLTDARPLADNPSPGVIQALRSSPEIVSDLLVKNLAMSSAMAVAHRRNQAEEMAQGSDRVRSRTVHLIQLVQLLPIQEQLQELLQSVTTGVGTYQSFLDRWGYDAEQRQAIQKAIAQVLAD
jgi:hypothetical protein